MKLDFSKTKLDYKVQSIISSLIRNRRVFIPGSLDKFDLINLGCGANIKDGFINLDYSWRPGIHLCWDLANGIPINDRSVRGAFTEHCLEHLKLTDCRRVFTELFRVLKPGGRVKIIVPNAELYLDAYEQKKLMGLFCAIL